MSGWAAILAAARAEGARFELACREPSTAQLALLREILERNADSAFGRAHQFDRIDTIARFRAQVPVRDYAGHRPWIERAGAGEAGVLTRAPVIVFEETGGSTSGRKLVPYTAASLAAFRAAVLPWLTDLADERPETFQGRAYVAVSPVARSPRITAGGIAVGLPSEGAYLGDDLASAIATVMAVPPEVATIGNVEEWRFTTLRHLVSSPDLTFISVWSPTFLIGLIEALPALEGQPIDTQRLWPRLATISAWADGASAPYARRLQELFPHARLQPKGLLATEGAITIPRRGSPYSVPALTSALLEFIDENGRALLCDELCEGASYRVVITTPGGLYRYDLGDRVRCRGYLDGLPRLEFVGRAGVATDIVGEKLAEDFVAEALRPIGGEACLAARAAATPFYELLIDAPADADLTQHAALIEARLRKNPQYAYARDIGQLGSVKPRPVERLLDRYVRLRAQTGCRLADIKPPVLIGDDDAYAALTEATAP